MHINNIEIFHVAMPITEPWVTAYGTQSSIESIFIHLKSDNADGWGECSPAPIPSYNSEYATGSFYLARDILAPILIGKEIFSGSELTKLFEHVKGHQFAKSAFDCAWWDAFSKKKKKPLWKLIGGKNQVVPVGADFPVQPTSEVLFNKVSAAVDDGFQRVKIKFNRDSSVASIAKIKTLYPDILVHIDCNSGFSLSDGDLFQELDKLGLAMIEQPLAYDDLIFHAELQSKIKTPICLDESITSVDRANKAIEIGACGFINIKTSRVGGLSNAIDIYNLCRKKDVPVWVGGMLESAVGQSFSLALATMLTDAYPSDIFPSSRFYTRDISFPKIVLSSPGNVSAPDTDGAGFSPDIDLLRKSLVNFSSLSV